MRKSHLTPENADRIERQFSNFDRKLGLFWSRFWACVLFVPVIPATKTAVVMVLQRDWLSFAFCAVMSVIFGGLAFALWRRGGRYGLLTILAEKDHPDKPSR